MTLTSDNRPVTSYKLKDKPIASYNGQKVKVIMWCNNMALCEKEKDGLPKRFWISKTKLK